MKKVIVISTSLRPGSNSHALAEQFAKGAEAAGHNPGGGEALPRWLWQRGKQTRNGTKEHACFREKISNIYIILIFFCIFAL